jgi:hypothetical protein
MIQAAQVRAARKRYKEVGFCTEQEMERLRRRLIKLVWGPRSQALTSQLALLLVLKPLVRPLGDSWPTPLPFAKPFLLFGARGFRARPTACEDGRGTAPPIDKFQSRCVVALLNGPSNSYR